MFRTAFAYLHELHSPEQRHTGLDKQTPDKAYFVQMQLTQAARNPTRMHLVWAANLSKQ